MGLGFRFPRSFRMRSSRDFSRVYRSGERARGDVLVVVGAPNGLGHPRLGLSVSKKIWKHAHRRNRVRRVFREAFRLSAPDLPAYDFVLIPAAPRLWPETPTTRTELQRLAHEIEARTERRARRRAARERAPGTRSGSSRG